ncbi:enoyl-CoA hydratase/isomerase family protein [Halobacterium wangiae]|uniref:enoyl-CoA hydratase/isomerase family protein n=1 Tax=Halobacterium wangiae TaxID=2902623 RepID=UPI001E3C68D2|nr:enoyl-CoA hydratase/isomerase family protein [Halobacterium wangiae]
MRGITTDRTDDGVRTIALDRPEKLNALDAATLRNLASAVADADEQVVVVEGRGRAFCAGADLEEAGEEGEDIDAYQDVTRAVRRHSGVVVGKLHGHVIGGGLELALAFDLRYAAADTTFQFPEVTLGAVVSNGATRLLPLVVGDGFAREMVLTGRPVDAEEALDHGLVAAVHSAEDLDEAVADVARRIADNPAVGVALNKRGLNRAFPVENALAVERDLHREHEARGASVDTSLD